MQEEGLHFDQVYDLIAFRIIVPTLRECYEALGGPTPVGNRFQDASRTTSRCPRSTCISR